MRARSGEELLDLVERRLLVAEPGHVVVAGQLDDLCTGNPLAHVAARLRQHLVGTVEHERGDANCGEDVADVDHRAHPRQRRRGGRAGETLERGYGSVKVARGAVQGRSGDFQVKPGRAKS